MIKPLAAVPDFLQLEKDILRFWQEKAILEKYLKRNAHSSQRFRFLDGPITANNPMAVHHAWGRTYKDFFQRYKNMQGFAQRFQNGFDCQGLWLEVEEEKSLGFNSKKDIEDYGIAKFCSACRARVEKYAAVQTKQSQRLGMFMDWENSYYTLSETNNLYIWYFLRKCHEKGWLYKGVNSMPWCVRCGTAISQHELSDGGYKMVEHEAVYVKFPLTAAGHRLPATSLLIWTTTPWTLLANVAVAVRPDYAYVKVKLGETEEQVILAKNRLVVLNEPYEVVEEFSGEKLLGLSYRGPFDELPAQRGVEHKVIAWEEVSESEGTGLVHSAPGAGEEDFLLGKKFNLAVLAPLDEFGIYLPGYGNFTSKDARGVNADVFASLRQKNLLYRTEKIVHSYPHCWRCKEPLVFRVSEEWFIKVEEIRPRLKEVAAKVDWRPSYVGKRMQDWLTNMGDWPISRRRYWGLALPFYECACGKLTVVGSKEELRQRAIDPEEVDKLPELHRPWIDEIKIKCPACGQPVSRVPYVGDCWLDAGVVPFSTLKYLEDRSYWEKWFPAEVVAEYVAQVKLWFYSLLFMSVTLEDRVPFETVFTDGYVVDEKGEIMHKSKGNAIWFDEAAEKMGADIMRWLYLRADPSRDLRFGYGLGDEVRRRFFLIFWNCVKFFLDYAAVDGWEINVKSQKSKVKSPSVLDKWILSRLNNVVKAVTAACDNYQPQTAALALEEFVSGLSTWYIRRSRGRVGPTAAEGEDKEAFYQTAHRVLGTLVKLLAPFTPFWTEELYKKLDGGKESVHLEDWPKVGENYINPSLEEQMIAVRRICELGHAARKAAGVRVRQPLNKFSIFNPPAGRAGFQFSIGEDLVQLIKDELNVKEVMVDKGEGELKVEFDTTLTPELKAEGEARELIRQVQERRKEKGCRLDERIEISTPSWPSEFTDLIKKETLAVGIKKSEGVLLITTPSAHPSGV